MKRWLPGIVTAQLGSEHPGGAFARSPSLDRSTTVDGKHGLVGCFVLHAGEGMWQLHT